MGVQELGHRGPQPRGRLRQDLQDDLDQCLPSRTSPHISPKSHRNLPSNLYVVLYKFLPRRPDELGLPAGSTVTILDTSDQDWWRGRCSITGQLGFLPATYLARLLPGERVHRVSQPCSLTTLTGEIQSLTRDQIMIELSSECQDPRSSADVMVRTGESSCSVRGLVPLRYLLQVWKTSQPPRSRSASYRPAQVLAAIAPCLLTLHVMTLSYLLMNNLWHMLMLLYILDQ